MNCWLMKSEPDSFSIDDLQRRPRRIEPWDGVRNYQARNFMRQMQVGERAFFYHSSCDEPGIVGLMRVAAPAYPDPTQFDPKHHHYDPASKPQEPRWDLVEMQFERKLKRVITLTELREHERKLQGLQLLARGNRLSIIPVKPAHWDYILGLE
ncbi:MAG: EVE domain-containing protein [Nevskia sp.]|nr:EVE domain-containing protein [Nevskia sp.]